MTAPCVAVFELPRIDQHSYQAELARLRTRKGWRGEDLDVIEQSCLRILPWPDALDFKRISEFLERAVGSKRSSDEL